MSHIPDEEPFKLVPIEDYKNLIIYANILIYQTKNGIYTGERIRKIGEDIIHIITGGKFAK